MKKLKHILFAFIFSLVLNSQAIVSNAASLSELQAGVYTISNDVSHENETGMAMARSYLKEKMTLEKSKGSWYYTIKFSGLQYMSKHKIYVNGSKVSHTVVSKNTSADTLELKFKTKSITPKLKVTMYVSAMGRNVEFGIIPKESTLKLVKATEESKSENSTNSSSNKTSNSTSNKNNSTSSNKTNNSSNSSKKSESKSDETEKETDKTEKETDKTEKETDKAEEETEEVVKESENEDKAEEDKEIEDENKAEEDKEDEKAVEKTSEEVVNEDSNEKSSNKLIFVGIGSIIVIAIAALVLRKIKK